jgi:hypothetical protein
MKMSRPDTDQTKAEKRKLGLMRQANSAASDCPIRRNSTPSKGKDG